MNISNNNSYMYLFVREDLSPAQQIIQVAHAVEKVGFISEHKETCNAVLIGVKNCDDLLNTAEFLFFRGIAHQMFFESDISEYTAIATLPLTDKERKQLNKFKLKANPSTGSSY